MQRANSMLTTSMAYRTIAATLPRRLELTSKDPQVAREATHYLSRIGDIKTIDEFVGSGRVFSFAMQAFGLKDMTYARAFMRKVLEGGIDSRDAFAMQLADPRYRDFAGTFNFARYGTAATAFARTQQGTVDRYVQQVFEERAGQDNEGVRLALYFQRKAPQVKSLVGILADPALLKVAQTAFGLPASMSLLSLEKQTQLLAQNFDVAQLQDQERLTRLLERFTGQWEIAQVAAKVGPTDALVLGGRASGLDTELLARIQSLKVGR